MSAHAGEGERNQGGTRLGVPLRTRWWVIIAAMALSTAGAYAISGLAIEAQYEATARVAYSQTDADVVSKALEDAGTARLAKTLATDALLVETSAFAERVSAALGGSVGTDRVHTALRATTPVDVEVIDITATAAETSLAANVANACADEFIKTRQEEVLRLLQSALDLVQGQILSLSPAKQGSAISATLEQERYALSALISRSLADYKVLERAAVPSSPSSPKTWLYLLGGLAAGLVLGLFIALLAGSGDRRIGDRPALERPIDLPVLGSTPVVSGRQGGKRTAIVLRTEDGLVLDSMRALRSNLKVLGFGETKRTLLVASASPGESASALAVNLTLSMALVGDRVILVDADLRNPTVDGYLSIPNTDGLGDVLKDSDLEWSERIRAVDPASFVDARLMSSRISGVAASGVSKFLCLTSGTAPADPREYLASPALRMLLADLRGYSDYVIVCGPSLPDNPDSLLLAQAVDAVILTTSVGKRATAEARQTRQLLSNAEIGALGLVICGVRGRGRDDYQLADPAGEQDVSGLAD